MKQPSNAPYEVLTIDEHKALELSREMSTLIRKIIGDGAQARNDWTELAVHIHSIENAILAQAAGRIYPTLYRNLGEE